MNLRILRIPEVQQRLSLSRASVDRLAQRGELDRIKLGPRASGITEVSLLAFVERQLAACNEARQ